MSTTNFLSLQRFCNHDKNWKSHQESEGCSLFRIDTHNFHMAKRKRDEAVNTTLSTFFRFSFSCLFHNPFLFHDRIFHINIELSLCVFPGIISHSTYRRRHTSLALSHSTHNHLNNMLLSFSFLHPTIMLMLCRSKRYHHYHYDEAESLPFRQSETALQ